MQIMLGRIFGIVFVATFFSLASAHGESRICSSLADCRDLKLKVEEQIKYFLDTHVPVFLDVAVDGNGAPIRLTQPHAMEYCAGLNAHLPTAREFAHLAKSFGAVGILELDYVTNNLEGELPKGYVMISAIDSDNSQDRFYYNRSGYKAPAGIAGEEPLWSSSTNKSIGVGSYLFFANSGPLVNFSNAPHALSAFRCVLN